MQAVQAGGRQGGGGDSSSKGRGRRQGQRDQRRQEREEQQEGKANRGIAGQTRGKGQQAGKQWERSLAKGPRATGYHSGTGKTQGPSIEQQGRESRVECAIIRVLLRTSTMADPTSKGGHRGHKEGVEGGGQGRRQGQTGAMRGGKE
uniref:Uncharacterized protein n=1 Tax=Knipowitschia caucasica TaxID=637954 RepID=A0AAV2M3A8_KNICA